MKGAVVRVCMTAVVGKKRRYLCLMIRCFVNCSCLSGILFSGLFPGDVKEKGKQCPYKPGSVSHVQLSLYGAFYHLSTP